MLIKGNFKHDFLELNDLRELLITELSNDATKKLKQLNNMNFHSL